LDTTTSPDARATIIWLVGEFAGVDPENNIAPDVLRILSKGFADESEVAKQQIVLLAAKVYLQHLLQRNQAQVEKTPGGPFSDPENGSQPSQPQSHDEHPVTILWHYVLLLARYDTSYDLRDRARLFKSLLALPSSTQLASLLLQAPKPVPHTPSPSESRRGLLIGSSSLVVGAESGISKLKGYEDLPEWVEDGQEPDQRLRDEERNAEYGEMRDVPAGEKLDNALKQQQQQQKQGVASSTNGVGIGSGKEKTLDDWLAEDEDEEETDEEGSSEEETTEEETDEESEDGNEKQRLVK